MVRDGAPRTTAALLAPMCRHSEIAYRDHNEDPSMRKLLATITALALIGTVGVALAAQQTLNGTIKSIDAKMHTFTLADGHSFVAGSKLDVASLKPGEKVQVTYEVQKGKWIADGMQAMK
jgi:hypothetical protein